MAIFTVDFAIASVKNKGLAWERLGAWGTVTAAGLAVATYKDSVLRMRRLETINELTEIRDRFPNMRRFAHKSDPESKDKLLAYLRRMERFSTGILEEIYDIDIVSNIAGTLLVSQYDEFMKDLIEERKAKTIQRENIDAIYKEYTAVIEKIRKIKKKKGIMEYVRRVIHAA